MPVHHSLPQWQEEDVKGLACISQSGFLDQLWETNTNSSITRSVPETSTSRQRASNTPQSLDQDGSLAGKVLRPHDASSYDSLSPKETVFYLAYGSNLSAETFLGNRGIRPLSQLNVVVPTLRLTFDLAGLPYIEPTFAGTHFRNPSAEDPCNDEFDSDRLENDTALLEKNSLLRNQDTDQTQYKGPLIGVVYEVTLTDYATIIATEGGGRGYKDIVVDCYPFPKGYDPADPIPERPDTQILKAHTLLSPGGMEGLIPHRGPKRPRIFPGVRPNPYYAQPSARYLRLITTGAAEHNLPLSYRAYLAQIQPYRITTWRQRIGQVVLLSIWGPLFFIMLLLTKLFAGPDGRSPQWVVKFADFVITSMWNSYDNFFLRVFGDGERTIED